MPPDNQIYTGLLAAKQQGAKKLAILFDPDKLRLKRMEDALDLAVECGVDYFFIGGSLVVNDMLDELLVKIHRRCAIPLILFPGNSFQLSYRANALLFLSLISGRNAELLIGQHVSVTASIGFVTFDGSQNADDILAAADAEMYTAKRSA